MRITTILPAAAVLARLWSAGDAVAQLPPGVIAFVHEDSGTTNPVTAVFNIRLANAQDPTQGVALTAFNTPPTLVQDLAWSRDFTTLFFASNFNNGLRSLEEGSVYAIAGDATALRQVTGGGIVGGLPGPFATVVGRVVAPNIGNIVGATAGCIVSAQGSAVTASCDTDGTFTLTGVPVGAAWVRGQADASYPTLGPGGPGLSAGFTTSFRLVAGQVVNAGLITIDPTFAKSIQPSQSPDGTRLVATSAQRTVVLQSGEWKPSRGNALFVWPVVGAGGPAVVPLPGPADLADMSGPDWSPVAERIACAATGTIAPRSGSFVLVIGPNGSNPVLLYQAPANPFQGAVFLVSETRFSPNGAQIAFVQSGTLLDNPFATWADLFVIDADGRTGRQLTALPIGEAAGSPSWSPDGRFIAFHVATTNQTTLLTERIDIVAIEVATGQITRLLTDGRSGWPAWRPGSLPAVTNPPPGGGGGGGDGGGGGGGGTGPCAERTAGVDTARCLLGQLGAGLCDAGVVDARLTSFLSGRVKRIDAALGAALASDKEKKRNKQLGKARRGLHAISTRVGKDATRRKRPLDAGCRDRLLGVVAAVRTAAFGG